MRLKPLGDRRERDVAVHGEFLAAGAEPPIGEVLASPRSRGFTPVDSSAAYFAQRRSEKDHDLWHAQAIPTFTFLPDERQIVWGRSFSIHAAMSPWGSSVLLFEVGDRQLGRDPHHEAEQDERPQAACVSPPAASTRNDRQNAEDEELRRCSVQSSDDATPGASSTRCPARTEAPLTDFGSGGNPMGVMRPSRSQCCDGPCSAWLLRPWSTGLAALQSCSHYVGYSQLHDKTPTLRSTCPQGPLVHARGTRA